MTLDCRGENDILGLLDHDSDFDVSPKIKEKALKCFKQGPGGRWHDIFNSKSSLCLQYGG